MDYIFNTCHSINSLLLTNREAEARLELIKLLDYHLYHNITYSPLVNHLIRETGLYPYLNVETADWKDRYAYEVFKVNTGDREPKTLHREQSALLKRLIKGEDIAVSAPTSFGKSFVIDAYISIAKPRNVVIIVPTIALTDETRRRLYKKFANQYKIITTTDTVLGDRNIFIFPQERAISYVDKVEELDLLIIDEFYKASAKYDKERSPTLLKAILKLSKIARQRYFLTPNITEIGDSPFTKGMTFENKLDFNTVYLEKHELYKEIGKDEEEKSKALLSILLETSGKSLIYAASYPQIDKVGNLIRENLKYVNKPLLNQFADWLTINYDSNWRLTSLVRRGTGIHNGQLHRSLSQIQIRLFEDEQGLRNIISTSSIIEGVNTSAENVIIWRNRKGGAGNAKLDDFTYKNIIGRGGRMFKHFVGKIYLLEAPPDDTSTQLTIDFPDTILADFDEVVYEESLTPEQVGKIIQFREEMDAMLGKGSFDRLQKENVFQLNDFEFIKKIARSMKEEGESWNGFAYLNSNEPVDWGWMLNKIIRLQQGGWTDGPYSVQYYQMVSIIKVLSANWHKTIPELLHELDEYDISIDQFFKLERAVSYKFSALLNDVNILHKEIINKSVDVSPFIAKVSHVFLPPVVYQLEEYGLPRMIARKLHLDGVINFEQENLNIHSAIALFLQIGKENLLTKEYFDPFDRYIIEYFFEGITVIQ